MEAKGLIESLVKHNITLSDKQLEQFKYYRELLQEYNKVMNLTAIIETDENGLSYISALTDNPPESGDWLGTERDSFHHYNWYNKRIDYIYGIQRNKTVYTICGKNQRSRLQNRLSPCLL